MCFYNLVKKMSGLKTSAWAHPPEKMLYKTFFVIGVVSLIFRENFFLRFLQKDDIIFGPKETYFIFRTTYCRDLHLLFEGGTKWQRKQWGYQEFTILGIINVDRW